MAVEVATLKPLFPGGNEVDQVWRVCEVMGSPGQWVGRSGRKMGGGEWREGTRLAGRLGFSFPRVSSLKNSSCLSSSTLSLRYLIETDGPCPNGIDSRPTDLACLIGTVRYLVFDVGSEEPTNVDPSSAA